MNQLVQTQPSLVAHGAKMRIRAETRGEIFAVFPTQGFDLGVGSLFADLTSFRSVLVAGTTIKAFGQMAFRLIETTSHQ